MKRLRIRRERNKLKIWLRDNPIFIESIKIPKELEYTNQDLESLLVINYGDKTILNSLVEEDCEIIANSINICYNKKWEELAKLYNSFELGVVSKRTKLETRTGESSSVLNDETVNLENAFNSENYVNNGKQTGNHNETVNNQGTIKLEDTLIDYKSVGNQIKNRLTNDPILSIMNDIVSTITRAIN